ncbi:hypothetical protein BC940DRAFT_326850 [Gongronella butleri]|nr:hypothetical protein BC940DRAFT_326850 [Gongronella butleri]
MSTISTIESAFAIDQGQFEAIVSGFKQEYATGLATAEAKGLATMIPSYVTRLPTGQEQGTYLALDLGGSTLRVCAVELLGNGKVQVDEVKRTIGMTDPLRTGQVEPFFDWMVDTVAMLLEKQQLDPASALSMGVSWSFPVDQTSLSDGTLLRMGKGFNLQDIEGRDLKTLFHDAFERKHLNVKVTALINDTVGVCVAHAYTHPGNRIGFIFGTGCNAAYPEKVDKIVKLDGKQWQQDGDAEMLVNTEIDIFGDEAYLPLNKYDRLLDAAHNQPKFQPYEKMMSGGYLGELVRLVALELIEEKQLFAGNTPVLFRDRYTFDTAYLSDIESRTEHSLEERLEYLQDILAWDQGVTYTATADDWDLLLQLCQIVATRSAKLAAAALASLVEQQADALQLKDGTQPIIIGINGSTFELYPQMPSRIMAALENWFGPNVAARISLEPARDGASIGGALIAMLYDDLNDSQKR